MSTVPTWQLRARFAAALSAMYAKEVPAYGTLVEVSAEVNRDVMARAGHIAERLGSLDRVTAERHGAIRVGTPKELSQVAQIFGALGMRPVGFYDLREAASSSIPVVSTAFRPVEASELARNPFRVFTSMLTPQDARFFSPELAAQLETFLASRELFPPELLALAERAEAHGGLETEDGTRFLELSVNAFRLSPEPIDRTWYETLERVSAVAADIGGVGSTHINHLTPRVLDIDELYARMTRRGVSMIDTIQGPPRWEGPDVLLRQTSFKALPEPRMLVEPDGRSHADSLRVRFGEVEARGIALTRKGRELYDRLLMEIDQQVGEDPSLNREDIARGVWRANLPTKEVELAKRSLAYFTFRTTGRVSSADMRRLADQGLPSLLDAGAVVADPIVYEDFLPRSAAGIFQSNLSGDGHRDNEQQGADHDAASIAGAIGREVLDPFDLYEGQQAQSLELLSRDLGQNVAAR
jgi:uncharacterized glyoxalase superfamily metalloenzyme YdcJ